MSRTPSKLTTPTALHERQGCVWVVDDSPVTAETVKRVLSARFRVEVFLEGESMLDRLSSSEPPDVLVLDWQLPGISGPDVCQLVRTQADELTLPILLMTGGERLASSAATALESGANDFVRKPFEQAEMLARVSTLARVRQLHKNLESARRAMQQKVDFEQQLVGIVSHDLRNPVAAIAMSAQLLLRQEAPDSPTGRGLLRIRSSADRAMRMIRDLLDFSQARISGLMSVDCRSADLSSIVRQVIEEVSTSAPERRLQLSAASRAFEGALDEDRISQVVSNLLVNAVKYSPPGTPVEVSLRDSEQELELSVRNEGPPIPQELFPRLFEPMQRGTRTADATSRSIGLGLYIVREIVRAHGGRVSVASTETGGTVFTVHLPKDGPPQAS